MIHFRTQTHTQGPRLTKAATMITSIWRFSKFPLFLLYAFLNTRDKLHIGLLSERKKQSDYSRVYLVKSPEFFLKMIN